MRVQSTTGLWWLRSWQCAFWTCLLVALLSAWAGAFPRDAERDRQPYSVPCATSQVTIDGVIDEPTWNDALMLELNYEVRPGENTRPPVRTIALITYDQRHVLVAFRAYDDHPERIRARFRDHDEVQGDDHVGVTLDTFNDQRRAYEFMVNPLGGQADGITNDIEGDYDESWDAIWDSAGRLTDFGYEVEIAIPFNQISFQATSAAQIWGIDLTRSWPRTDRVHIGLFPRDRGANSYLAQTEKIIGFAGVSPGRNLEVAPTFTGFSLRERPDFPPDTTVAEERDLELGATTKWGVTPNITLTAALSPDFSQIEADAVQLSLNERFELFYEEKRPLFLESADYFSTGVELLYTRMIADPLAALKVTGKVGRHTVAVISAYDEVTNLIVPGPQDSESDIFDASNTALVGRYRYDLGQGSTIGAFVSDRRGSDGYANRLLSADARLRPTAADTISVNIGWSTARYSIDMQTALDLGGDEIIGDALNLEYVHSTRNWFVFAEYEDLDEDFRADLGFIPRVGYRAGNAGGGYVWWGDNRSLYRRMEVGAWTERTVDQHGGLLSRISELWFDFEGPLESQFHLEVGDRIVVHNGVRFERLFVPSAQFEIRPSGSFGFEIKGTGGDWVDFDHLRPADRTRVEVDVELDLGRHLSVEFEYLYSTLDVDGGRLFTAHVPQLAAVWQFNTRTFLRAILQYTDIERDQRLYEEIVEELERDSFVQLLYSYKVNPRTVLFLGYSEGAAETADIARITTGRAVFFKIGYAWLW